MCFFMVIDLKRPVTFTEDRLMSAISCNTIDIKLSGSNHEVVVCNTSVCAFSASSSLDIVFPPTKLNA